MMTIGEQVEIENVVYYVHHIDDHEGWEKIPVLYPSFTPGTKPIETSWNCKDGHKYDV